MSHIDVAVIRCTAELGVLRSRRRLAALLAIGRHLIGQAHRQARPVLHVAAFLAPIVQLAATASMAALPGRRMRSATPTVDPA
jgi:hypothetical protein